MPAYSFSSVKEFQQCPRKYHELKVLKNYKQEDTEILIYGKEVHAAAEFYVKEDKPLGPHVQFQPVLDILKAMPGEKHTELRMAINKDFQPVDFFAEDVWFRGVADLSIVSENEARIFDYKLGKATYPDTDQLELMALMVFAHFPTVNKVRASLLFLLYDKVIPPKGEIYLRSEFYARWAKWLGRVSEIVAAEECGVWNAKPNGLCRKYCPVVSCEHNGKGK